MPPAMVRCPNCGHALVTVDLPTMPQLQALAPARPPRDDAPLLLRIPEAAKLLSISRTTLYQLVARGEVPVLRIGRSVRISRTAVERLERRDDASVATELRSLTSRGDYRRPSA